MNRSIVLKVYLASEKEKELLTERAAQLGRPLSKYARDVLLMDAYLSKPIDPDSNIDMKLFLEDRSGFSGAPIPALSGVEAQPQRARSRKLFKDGDTATIGEILDNMGIAKYDDEEP